ncbi:hypothetical protein [Streptomyces luteireticuli]|uniref:GE37468 family thiazolyl peptide n=1 Tax=Streptomyces luteireticuli TaxID=173858 RepID=A0ABP3IQK0_9ACTN
MEDLFDLDVEEIAAPSFDETGAADALGFFTAHNPVTGRICNPETGCIC